MQRTLLTLALAAGCLLAVAVVRASYLEGDQTVDQVRPPVRPVPPPEPVPARDNPLTRVVRRLRVQSGYTYDGLTVFQVEMGPVKDDTDYLSMGEALNRGDLEVREKGSASVPSLQARNSGSRSVLLLAGEIVSGGKQNRVLQGDLLLSPRSGWTELPVLCIEHGRWDGRSEFKDSPSVALLSVRSAAQSGAGQQHVWEEVGRSSAQLGAASPTQDLQAAQESPEVREAVGRYRDEFRRHWKREAVGMVVARWGRVVGADVFCNADVFLKHRDRLLESYAVDCYAWRREHARLLDGPVIWPDPGEAERFLRRVFGAGYEEVSRPGTGRGVNVQGADIYGTGIVRGDALLHAALFPRDRPVIQPVEPPIRRPLPE